MHVFTCMKVYGCISVCARASCQSYRIQHQIICAVICDAATSVTRLGDLFDFRLVFKPLATINLPKYPTFLGNFCKVSKYFQGNHFWATFIDVWRFFWSHWACDPFRMIFQYVVPARQVGWQVGSTYNAARKINLRSPITNLQTMFIMQR